MIFKEFGQINKPTILLIPGEIYSWQAYMPHIQNLEKNYHILIPKILRKDTEDNYHFESISNSSQAILDYLDKYKIEKPFCLIGYSLGAQIILDLLTKRKDLATYALIESPFFNNRNNINKKKNRQLYNKIIKERLDLDPAYPYINLASPRQDHKNKKHILEEITNYKIDPKIADTNTKILLINYKDSPEILKDNSKFLHNLITKSKLVTIDIERKTGFFILLHHDRFLNLFLRFVSSFG